MEKMYTVEDIAQMTSVTTRTIRNYLRDGQLKGRKLGGQWRFTQEDVERFLQIGEVQAGMNQDIRQEILDFMDGVNTDLKGTVQICSIIDLYVPQEEGQEKSQALCRMINERQGEACLRFRYDYVEAENKARFVLFASPALLSSALQALGL